MEHSRSLTHLKGVNLPRDTLCEHVYVCVRERHRERENSLQFKNLFPVAKLILL